MQSLLDAIDRAEREARPPSPKNQWSHHNVQAVETSRLDEARKSTRASFHEHAPEAEVRQRHKNFRRRDLSVRGRQRYGFDSAHGESGSCSSHHYCPTFLIAQAYAVGHPSARVHHDAYRVGAGNAAYGQLRIVSTSSLDPHDDGIDQSAQAMKMFERSGAIDVMRTAGSGRHSAVERLADLAGDHKIVDLSRP